MQANVSERLTALIIDDSDIIRDRLAEILYAVKGVKSVGKASGAKEGLEQAAAGRPALVVLDVRLPDASGIEILKNIKQLQPAPVVAVLTNYPFPSYRQRCVELGADYFLDKSSEFNEITNIMAGLIGGRECIGAMNDAGTRTRKAKILLVEDNAMNRDMLSRRLARKGYNVIVAADGPEALEKVVVEHPDLILMDLRLPEIDGWEVTRRLKGDAATRHIPVIALTAHAMPPDREAALAAGCDDFDVKPIDFSRLLAKIEGQLHVAHAH
jgi:CheY-like chemotaxis protein